MLLCRDHSRHGDTVWIDLLVRADRRIGDQGHELMLLVAVGQGH
ncbi:hypothetical protein [Acaryochloris marina]|nr:hypothetical protein [Acaryochloris marina]